MNDQMARKLKLASVLAVALAIQGMVASLSAADLAPLPLKLPAPTTKGTPEDLPTGPMIEKLSDKPRAPFMAPKGVENVALNKKVTSSVNPFTGTLSQIADGQKEAFDDQVVEMKKGPQWVQVDLGAATEVYAVLMWHDHRYLQTFKAVIVQASDDPEFKNNVTTLFNNDVENMAGQGIGKDRMYFETQEGRLVDAKGVKARYVRCYTNGSHLAALNSWQEIEVYGLPAK